MTDTRHEQPRCAICRWPYRPDGCTPGSCCFRPHENTDEYAANAKRRAAYDRLRDAGNPAPTLEDVDAELQPKGLQVLTLTEPVWVNGWLPRLHGGGSYRYLLRDAPTWPNEPTTYRAEVLHCGAAKWCFDAGVIAGTPVEGQGITTPEAAQAACEAAIVAAWRNR